MRRRYRLTNIRLGSADVAAPNSGVIAGRVYRAPGSRVWEAWSYGADLGSRFLTRRAAAHAIWEAIIVPQGLDGWAVNR